MIKFDEVTHIFNCESQNRWELALQNIVTPEGEKLGNLWLIVNPAIDIHDIKAGEWIPFHIEKDPRIVWVPSGQPVMNLEKDVTPMTPES